MRRKRTPMTPRRGLGVGRDQEARLRPSSRMHIQFYIRGFNASAEWRQRMERSLCRLRGLLSIDAAAVVFERQEDTAPAYQAFVQLAVSGPDIHAEARDHTPEAVWLKVTAGLRSQIEQRFSRRDVRAKSRLQMPITASRWTAVRSRRARKRRATAPG